MKYDLKYLSVPLPEEIQRVKELAILQVRILPLIFG